MKTQYDMQSLFNEALTKPGMLSDAYARFYEFSIGNSILALLQAGNQPVATYKRWQSLGRQVKRGAQAISLLVPVSFKKDKEDENSETITLFKSVNRWFKLEDTEGEPLSHELKTPEFNLDQALSALDIEKVEFTESNYNMQGYAYKNSIAINPAAKYPLKTAIHEIAHVLLGHTKDTQHSDTLTLEPSVMEVEAESVAYLVMSILGHEQVLTESRGYIQSWYSDSKREKIRVSKIFGIADKIIKAGGGKVA
jgi:antirestriction protein ArdC